MREELSNYLDLLRRKDIVGKYPDHTIYMWSNFVLNESPDVDLQFVGEVKEELAISLWDLRWELEAEIPKKVDIQMYENTRIFNHIDRFNACTDSVYICDEEIIRYKCREPKNFGHNGREISRAGNNYWKIKQIFARRDGKYATRNWPEPKLLTDLL